MNTNFSDDLRKSFLNESVDFGDEEGQFNNIKESEYNGKKYSIVQDENTDLYGYAVDGLVSFDDYPNFEWGYKSMEEAESEAKKTIDSIGVDDSMRNEDAVRDFIKEKCGGCFVQLQVKGEKTLYSIVEDKTSIDVADLEKELSEKFQDKTFSVCRINVFNKPTLYVDATDGKVDENATPEDKQAAEVLNGVADAKEKSGEKEKADALRDAAKTLEESVKDIGEKVTDFLKAEFGVDGTSWEQGLSDPGKPKNISFSFAKPQNMTTDNLKKIAEFVKKENNQSELPEVYVDDPKHQTALYIGEIADSDKVDESASHPGKLKPFDTFFYGFIVPSYVVEEFGKKPFLEKGFVENDGKIALVHAMKSDDDIKEFFHNAYEFVNSDSMSVIKTLVEELNEKASEDDKLDVEIETVLNDVKNEWFYED